MVHADYKMGSTAYAQVCPRVFRTYIARVSDITLLSLSFAARESRRCWRGSQGLTGEERGPCRERPSPVCKEMKQT
jgi:hypothetical protein